MARRGQLNAANGSTKAARSERQLAKLTGSPIESERAGENGADCWQACSALRARQVNERGALNYVEARRRAAKIRRPR